MQPQNERQFMDNIIRFAHLRGWRLVHQRPARLADGSWRTAICGHAGYPDITMVRDGVLIFAELKTDKGKLSGEQKDWIRDLERVQGIIVRVWRPSDWPEIEKLLM